MIVRISRFWRVDNREKNLLAVLLDISIFCISTVNSFSFGILVKLSLILSMLDDVKNLFSLFIHKFNSHILEKKQHYLKLRKRELRRVILDSFLANANDPISPSMLFYKLSFRF